MVLVEAFTVLCAIYMVGQWGSKFSKGVIPSSLLCSVLLLIGFWTGGFPKDIVAISGLDSVYNIMSALIIVNMGTTLEFSQFKEYWKITVAVIFSCVCLSVITVFISSQFVGNELAKASFPILMGGIRATQIMTDALNERGLAELAAIIVLLNSTQSFFGLPMISLSTKRTVQRALINYRSNNKKSLEIYETREKKKEKVCWIDQIPDSLKTPFLHLFTLGVAGILSTWLGEYTSQITGGIVGRPLLALVLGIFFHQVGLMTSNPMQKSGTMPFFFFATIIAISGNLSALSPSDLMAHLGSILVLLILGTAGLFGGSFLMGKLMKVDIGLAIASSFGAYAGYPLNYQVAQEVIYTSTENEKERSYLEKEILPIVSLGSIISVTITSVIVAGALASML